jgi:hypothetical protein
MEHELGLTYGASGIVRHGAWDSLRKGLLAGDLLAYDLKRLDVAYLEGSTREYELTKHVSLAALAPQELIRLKETGQCRFEVPEWLFDLDTPGHYQRRLRMVSVTIPCVTGPYTGVHCTLRLHENSYRRTTARVNGQYTRQPEETPGNSERFVDDRRRLDAIVTSSGQNDTGLFDASPRDERYLPFEGAGAVSTWELELPTDYPTLDYRTITDVVLHLRYSARDAQEDPTFRTEAKAAVTAILGDITGSPLVRLFSVRHEFPAEWYRFTSSPNGAPTSVTLDLGADRFPYFAHGRPVQIRQARVLARSGAGPEPVVAIAPGMATPPDLSQPTWEQPAQPGPWTLGTGADPHSLSDLFVVVSYSI